MEDNKNKVDVIGAYNYSDRKYKIAKLRFPIGIRPEIGMKLLGAKDKIYIISGIVFESDINNNIWDCKIKVDSDDFASEISLEL